MVVGLVGVAKAAIIARQMEPPYTMLFILYVVFFFSVLYIVLSKSRRFSFQVKKIAKQAHNAH